IQTILSNEKLATTYSRLDEIFYYTMKAIVDRLSFYLEVEAPVDNGRALVTREVDYQRMRNWKSRLESNLQNLEVLFDAECTYKDAINAWRTFFNHSYWGELELSAISKRFSENKLQDFNDTEEFIEDLYPIYEQYDVTIDCKVSGNGFSSIDCKVSGNGFSSMPILEYLDKFTPILKKFIPYNFSVKCRVGRTNCPSYDKILWKVLNVGAEAERRNDIRGQIQDRGKEITENSKFL